MPRENGINSILVIGAGPIIIGQACEFDYSGSQACKALKSEGYEVILINSNPATIMTDPEFADKTYIEPIEKEIVKKIIQRNLKGIFNVSIGKKVLINDVLNWLNFYNLKKVKLIMQIQQTHFHTLNHTVVNFIWVSLVREINQYSSWMVLLVKQLQLILKTIRLSAQWQSIEITIGQN